MYGIAPELNEIEISFLSLEALAEFTKNKSVLYFKIDSDPAARRLRDREVQLNIMYWRSTFNYVLYFKIDSIQIRYEFRSSYKNN